jgi:tRNA threonylcarbamoyladenosine biosynthesis protein TsaB
LNILAIDTSAQVASVCVLNENTILSEFSVNAKLTHSQTMMPMVRSALECAKMELSQIDAFAVSAGPGSFTGIRIGVSAVKGLAMACGKPCIPVSTLEGLAYNLMECCGILCAVMDARCNQVYNALFRWEDGHLHRLCSDRAISIKDLGVDLDKFDEKIFLVGDGADLCYNNLKEELPFLQAVPPHLKLQRAASTGLAAVKRFEAGETCSAAELMPVYLRLPQAERELLKKQGK